eukprot:jgi/Mesvir1/8720/Mv02649-RA.2
MASFAVAFAHGAVQCAAPLKWRRSGVPTHVFPRQALTGLAPAAKLPKARRGNRLGYSKAVTRAQLSSLAADEDYGEDHVNARWGDPYDNDAFFDMEGEDSGVDYFGQSRAGDFEIPADMKVPLSRPLFNDLNFDETDAMKMLESFGVEFPSAGGNAKRDIFCSRTVNLRSISAIGYDMDYTLVHYDVQAWEGAAYDYGMAILAERGCRTDNLVFDPDLVIRGLVIDKELGNVVKADRFGYVKRAMHGTSMLSNRAISELYGRELVDLRDEKRWVFLNTFFSVSEAVMYMQVVEKFDEGSVPADIASMSYMGLYKVVADALFRAHVDGPMKARIMANPEKFVIQDPLAARALLDQKEAGKKLLLITNSDYSYTKTMMDYAYNPFLPAGMVWRDLFDMVIVSARKPNFFTDTSPLYEIVTDDGLMKPASVATPGGLYCGGCAMQVERALGISGDETLYVGDHIYTDVSISKNYLRWRTALICRELEEEVEALEKGREHRLELIKLMNRKAEVGYVFNQLRLALQRKQCGQPIENNPGLNAMTPEEVTRVMSSLLLVMERLDEDIAPRLEEDGHHFNKRWGYLSRAGLNDKSHLTRQIEKYADIYMSRVSNFLHYTPFMYFRSPSQVSGVG